MSIVGIATIATAAVGIGSKVYGGVMASQLDNSDAVVGAGQMSMAEKAQMGQETDLKMKQITAKTDSMMEMATSNGQKSMMGVFQASQKSASSDFAGNQAADSAIGQAKADVYQDYSQRVDSILQDDDLNKESVSLSRQRQLGDIEKRYQSNISAAQSSPDSFWEGFTGQSDYKTG